MTDQLFDDDQLPDISRPRPTCVLILPDEILTLQQATFFARRSERWVRDLGNDFGISRQTGLNGKLEFSAPALFMVLQGRFDLLERLRSGDRRSAEICMYFDTFGIPGPGILQHVRINDHDKGVSTRFRKKPIPPSIAARDLPSNSNQETEMDALYDENGNDSSVALMLNGGVVLDSFRTKLVLAANRSGMTVNQFVLLSVGRQLVEGGSKLNGVFVQGDLEEEGL